MEGDTSLLSDKGISAVLFVLFLFFVFVLLLLLLGFFVLIVHSCLFYCLWTYLLVCLCLFV